MQEAVSAHIVGGTVTLGLGRTGTVQQLTVRVGDSLQPEILLTVDGQQISLVCHNEMAAQRIIDALHHGVREAVGWEREGDEVPS